MLSTKSFYIKLIAVLLSCWAVVAFGQNVDTEDSPEFIACKKIKPNGNFDLMKEKKNCFRDLAKTILEDSEAFFACQKIKPKGQFDLMKEKKNCFRDLGTTLAVLVQDTPGAPPVVEPPIKEMCVENWGLSAKMASFPSVAKQMTDNEYSLTGCGTQSKNIFDLEGNIIGIHPVNWTNQGPYRPCNVNSAIARTIKI